jgi:hypothetical protein
MRLLLIITALSLFAGCGDQDRPRQYTEVVSPTPAAPGQKLPNNPPAGIDINADNSSSLSWALPKGWKQGADKGGMRLASFYLESNPDVMDCYIVSLPGMAGGLEANLKRWMGQADINPTDLNYQKLINTALTLQTKGGLEAKVYDLTSLKQVPGPKSMMAAIISTADTTIFVKMTGTSGAVKANRDAFLEFLKSLAAK